MIFFTKKLCMKASTLVESPSQQSPHLQNGSPRLFLPGTQPTSSAAQRGCRGTVSDPLPSSRDAPQLGARPELPRWLRFRRSEGFAVAPRGLRWSAGRWEAGLSPRRCARRLLSVHNLETHSKSPALPAVHNPSVLMHWFCRAPSVPRAPGTRHGSSDAGESCRCLWCPVPSSLSLPGPCSGEETMS